MKYEASLVNDFIKTTVESVRKELEKEARNHAAAYAKEIENRLVLEAMTKLNDLRVDLVQSMDRPGLEIRIVVGRNDTESTK